MAGNGNKNTILTFPDYSDHSDYSDRRLYTSDGSSGRTGTPCDSSERTQMTEQITSSVRPQMAEQIKKYRKKAKISQKDLADRLNVTRNTVINWESGKFRPDADLFLPLCQLFGISIDELFGIEPGAPGAPSPGTLSSHERSLIDQYRMVSPLSQRIIDRMIESILEEETGQKNRFLNDAAHGVGVISTKAAAGDGFEYSDIPMEDYRFVFLNGRNKKADAIIQVKGNSMLPVYHENDWLYVQYTESAETGEDVICSSRAGLHVKRLGEDGPYSVNTKEPFMLTNEEDNVRIIGRVLGIVDANDYPSASEEEILNEMRKDEIREFREKYQLV